MKVVQAGRIDRVRNTGWYIPFWKKSKRQGGEQQGNDRSDRRRRPRTRSDDELERVRSEWIARYNAQARALRTLGLSIGAPHADVKERYEKMMRALPDTQDVDEHRREVEAAYQVLSVEL